MRFLLVLLGGAVGSLARYTAGMVINITGSFLIGIIMTVITERFPGDLNWRPLLVTGFLSGYTTFPASSWRPTPRVRHGGLWIGVVNIVGSVGLGYGAVWLGASIVRK